jgi:NADPH:quinone reductase-like Zn-dependent oxidoreductase
VQLLLIALPDASLISTSSPKHHALIKSLGANTVLDYTAADIVQEIYTASPGGSGVEAIVDTVNGVVTNPELLQTLTGPKQFTEVVTGQMATDIPAEIKHTLVFGRKVMTTSGGPNLFSALGVLLASGEYKPPLPITVVGKGLESIGEGLEKLKAGVSGTKLVIKL